METEMSEGTILEAVPLCFRGEESSVQVVPTRREGERGRYRFRP